MRILLLWICSFVGLVSCMIKCDKGQRTTFIDQLFRNPQVQDTLTNAGGFLGPITDNELQVIFNLIEKFYSEIDRGDDNADQTGRIIGNRTVNYFFYDIQLFKKLYIDSIADKNSVEIESYTPDPADENFTIGRLSQERVSLETLSSTVLDKDDPFKLILCRKLERRNASGCRLPMTVRNTLQISTPSDSLTSQNLSTMKKGIRYASEGNKVVMVVVPSISGTWNNTLTPTCFIYDRNTQALNGELATNNVRGECFNSL